MCMCVQMCVHCQSEGGVEVVRGVRMKDRLTGEEWDVRAKVVINATGTSFTGYMYNVAIVSQASYIRVCIHIKGKRWLACETTILA